tara:strand:- start:67 stop:375 length:309 start_codon:yes stop_codon:yes gene_type:complete
MDKKENQYVNKVGATYFATSPSWWRIGINPTEAIERLLECQPKIDRSEICLWYIPDWEAITHFEWFAPYIKKGAGKKLGAVLIYGQAPHCEEEVYENLSDIV